MSEQVRFVADAMLGSLARKLRIFGFDTVYFREGPDSELLALAKAQGRIVLTSDRALAAVAKRRAVAALLVEGRSERERLASLEQGATRESLFLKAGASRCALCNTPLERLKRLDVEADLPAGVKRHHRVYYRCPECDKLYWKGSHWRKLMRLSSILPRQ
ncbi:MAG: Mut7-C RNAse domain-containing protein [Thaumarchaeota archaeon]|nr:Mut7-C RNAse domain-containing protein [Nitrososphaerota archaeon]